MAGEEQALDVLDAKYKGLVSDIVDSLIKEIQANDQASVNSTGIKMPRIDPSVCRMNGKVCRGSARAHAAATLASIRCNMSSAQILQATQAVKVRGAERFANLSTPEVTGDDVVLSLAAVGALFCEYLLMSCTANAVAEHNRRDDAKEN